MPVPGIREETIWCRSQGHSDVRTNWHRAGWQRGPAVSDWTAKRQCPLYHHPHPPRMVSPMTSQTSTSTLAVYSVQPLSCVQTITLALTRPQCGHTRVQVVQALLGLVVILSLVYKRQRESPKRPWRIWVFDVAKQLAGQMFVHGVNLLISGIVAQRKSGNACVLYFLNILVDTTLGTRP